MIVFTDVAVIPESKGRIRFLSGGRHLHIANAMKLDAASYTCIASNTAGNATKKYNVKLYGNALSCTNNSNVKFRTLCMKID